MPKEIKRFDSQVYVTAPVLPPVDEFILELKDIWESGWLTNSGQKSELLEDSLSEYLRAPNLS